MDCAEYNDVLRLLKKVRELREQGLDKEHTDIAETYKEIGVVYLVRLRNGANDVIRHNSTNNFTKSNNY